MNLKFPADCQWLGCESFAPFPATCFSLPNTGAARKYRGMNEGKPQVSRYSPFLPSSHQNPGGDVRKVHKTHSWAENGGTTADRRFGEILGSQRAHEMATASKGKKYDTEHPV